MLRKKLKKIKFQYRRKRHIYKNVIFCLNKNYLVFFKDKNARMGRGTGNYIKYSIYLKKNQFIFFFKGYNNYLWKKSFKFFFKKTKLNFNVLMNQKKLLTFSDDSFYDYSYQNSHNVTNNSNFYYNFCLKLL